MKRLILTTLLLTLSQSAMAQKYALLDLSMATPVRFTGQLRQVDISNSFFPIEKDQMKELLDALQKISRQLEHPKGFKAMQFHLGCARIEGTMIVAKREHRFVYTMKSNCEDVRASFILCDPNLSNRINGFVVNSWIKYISKNLPH